MALLTQDRKHVGIQAQVHISRTRTCQGCHRSVINTRLGGRARVPSESRPYRTRVPRSNPFKLTGHHSSPWLALEIGKFQKSARKHRPCCLVAAAFSWTNE